MGIKLFIFRNFTYTCVLSTFIQLFKIFRTPTINPLPPKKQKTNNNKTKTKQQNT